MRRLSTRLRRLSLRRRLALAATTAVALAIAIAAAITFLVVRGELRSQVDDSLRSTVEDLGGGEVLFVRAAPAPESSEEAAKRRDEPVEQTRLPPPGEVGPGPFAGTKGKVTVRLAPDVEQRLVVPAPPLGGSVRFAQLVRSNGRVIRSPQVKFGLPHTKRAAALAKRGRGSYFSDGEVRGTHVRVFTRALGRGTALQVARPVEETDGVLRRLAGVLAAVTFGGVALAGGMAFVVVRTTLKPVSDLSETAEHVARTRDLSARIDAESPDELGRLASSFNMMLAALERSVASQRQLVADASHELRTPLTSLRANIEVLAASSGMTPAARERLLADVVAQLEELTVLVGDLVDLAREQEQEPFVEDLRLDTLVGEVVARAERRHPERRFAVSAEPSVVRGAAGRLDRAVANLIDNAEKWSPAEAPIEIAVAGGEVRVRDYGPGIDDEDLPFVFDRFYRAPAARGLTGSGLGLAIVRHVAETHGGDVAAEPASGGGACLRLRLPATIVSDDDKYRQS